MEISLEKMKIEDLELIDLKNFDDFWTESILKDEILSDSSYYIVARFQNDIIGFAGLKFLLDEAHITNIATRIDKRKNGVGSKLLESLINRAKEEASVLITLEVNTENLPAINLYKKYGFEILGVRKKYYDNKFDAYIMTKYFN